MSAGGTARWDAAIVLAGLAIIALIRVKQRKPRFEYELEGPDE